MSAAETEAGRVRILGQGLNRVDAPAKVTGRADYAADHLPPGLAHAVGVFSTIAHGRVAALDLSAAERAPGVLAIIHHGNAPKLYRSSNDMKAGTRVGEVRPPFEDDRVYYAGQFVAVVVAERFEQARAAARLVRIAYEVQPPALSLEEGLRAHGARKKKDTPDDKWGDPDSAFASAPVRIDALFTTPVETHNPMELHASVAAWHGRALETRESTQWVVGQHKALAAVVGVASEQVTVLSPYIGGGFGGKLFLWPHTVVAAVAARAVDRPVKLVLERKNEFTTVGHRPATRQRIKLGADRDGRLLSIQHDSLSHTSLVDDFVENCGDTTRSMYACGNLEVSHRLVSVNVGTPTSMRAPGAASGTFALESAMDELAVALGIDPIELRLRNFAERDGGKRLPWSANHLKECYRTASARFGWARRNPAPGSMRDGDEILGWGFAAASWPSPRQQAQARAELRADGTARISCATQDIGTGTYTVFAQTAAEVLGLPIERIEVALGHSGFPEGPISGGSMVTTTVVPAVAEACRDAIERLREVAAGSGGPFDGEKRDAVAWEGGVFAGSGGRRAGIAEILGARGLAAVEGKAKAEPGKEARQYSFRSFGAHCVEVRWDPGLARLRVSRVASAFDIGRAINRKTAASQLEGGIMMGLGMALLERALYDGRTGRVLNDNLADYLVPVHADAPRIDVSIVDIPDPSIGEFGARGAGEIGITGMAAAVANAVYHATGRRLRDLPMTGDQLLT